MTQEERRLFLIKELLNETDEYKNLDIPQDEESRKVLLRGLMNVREPKSISKDFLRIQDEYLKNEISNKGITDIDDLKPVENGIYIWKGDITTLRCDAVVNAANNRMTGCYIPNHHCIDNAIHTYAGIELRTVCGKIMENQKGFEPTGKAKITPAFNLPCRYILHTVGPVIYDEVTKMDCDLLQSCYRSCLELAAECSLESIAFCCISTGEFRFPNRLAAETAVKTVKDFMNKKTSIKKVIFNVFKDTDEKIYRQLLGAN